MRRWRNHLIFFFFLQWKQVLLLVMKIIGIVKGLLLFVCVLNKNKYLRFCKISLKKIGCRFCRLLSFRTAQKWTETLHRLLVAQFFSRFLKLLFKWKYISRIGLFIRYYLYIYIYIYNNESINQNFIKDTLGPNKDTTTAYKYTHKDRIHNIT